MKGRRRAILVVGIPLLLVSGCQAEEIRRQCAADADPAACERAEYEKLREADRRRERERLHTGGGGGSGGY